MEEVVALLHGIGQCILDKTTKRRMVLVILAMLAMVGRVTMLGTSRRTEKGGSYRSVQRLFDTPIDWSRLMVTCVALWFADEETVFLPAGDKTVVAKAGKQTRGPGQSAVDGRPLTATCVPAPTAPNRLFAAALR